MISTPASRAARVAGDSAYRSAIANYATHEQALTAWTIAYHTSLDKADHDEESAWIADLGKVTLCELHNVDSDDCMELH